MPNLDLRSGAYSLDASDNVWRLGGIVEASADISWLPPEATGYLPLHAFLVRVGEVANRHRWVLIDTSLPVLEKVIVGQIDSIAGADIDLTLLFTRQVEYECIGNAAAILQRYSVVEARSNDIIEEVAYFHPKWDPAEQHQRGPWWPHGIEVDTTPLTVDETLIYGDQRFRVIRAPLRLLATVWIYHENSGTLFTSDAFATGCLPGPDVMPIFDEANWDIAELEAYLTTKFAWLARADVTPILGEIDRILDGLSIQCLAPAHGYILRGHAAKQFLSDFRTILASYSEGT